MPPPVVLKLTRSTFEPQQLRDGLRCACRSYAARSPMLDMLMRCAPLIQGCERYVQTHEYCRTRMHAHMHLP